MCGLCENKASYLQDIPGKPCIPATFSELSRNFPETFHIFLVTFLHSGNFPRIFQQLSLKFSATFYEHFPTTFYELPAILSELVPEIFFFIPRNTLQYQVFF